MDGMINHENKKEVWVDEKFGKKTHRVFARVNDLEYAAIMARTRPEDGFVLSDALRQLIRAGINALPGDKVDTKNRG